MAGRKKTKSIPPKEPSAVSRNKVMMAVSNVIETLRSISEMGVSNIPLERDRIHNSALSSIEQYDAAIRLIRTKEKPSLLKYLIFAGTYSEAENFVFQEKLPEGSWRYVVNDSDLAGTRGRQIAFVGSFAEKIGLNESAKELISCGYLRMYEK